MNEPLMRYLDAVVGALEGTAGKGVHGSATEDGVTISLGPDWAAPKLAWTPSTGWRISSVVDGAVRPSSIRYLHLGPVPTPGEVVWGAQLWVTNPDALHHSAPSYETSPDLLARALGRAAAEQPEGSR